MQTKTPVLVLSTVAILSQPGAGLGEAARRLVFLAGQHFVRRGPWTGTRDAQTHHPGHGSPHCDADGRLLAVNTINLDTGTSRVFDLVAEAQRAADSGQVDRIRNIMQESPARFRSG